MAKYLKRVVFVPMFLCCSYEGDLHRNTFSPRNLQHFLSFVPMFLCILRIVVVSKRKRKGG